MTRQHPHLPARIALAVVFLLLTLACQPATAAIGDSEVIRVYDVPRERYRELRYLGDFWGIDWRENYVSLYVTPRGREAVERLGFRVATDERRTRALAEFAAIDRSAWFERGPGGIPNYPCYRTVDETNADLSSLAANHPNLARWESIGESWLAANNQPGGDDLFVLVIGNQDSPHPRAPLMIIAAQHARELTTAEAAARFAEWLLDNYTSDPTARWLVDHRDIHIIAQQNPDGRRAVESGSMMWRKNANMNACPGGPAPGIDLNRNSNHFWGDHSSGSACEQTYRGLAAASEPETVAIHDYMEAVFTRHRDDLNDPVPDHADGLFLSLHSFSEMILFPWSGKTGGSGNHAPNHNHLAWLGRKLGYFTGYQVGRAILYPAGGTTTDHAHAEYGVASYTYEIGTTFQQSCSSFENAIWPDILESLIYAAKAAERPYQAPLGPDVPEVHAIHDTSEGTIRISGLADDTRYARGGVSEGPAADPVFNISEIRLSFDLPPELAESTTSLVPEEASSVVSFEHSMAADPEGQTDLPRLLFAQAVNSEGAAGVPTATWILQRRARITPDSIHFTVAPGASAVREFRIDNIGNEPLAWTVADDHVANRGQVFDPERDETLSLTDFELPSGGSYSTSAAGGQDGRGQVVGFSFAGTVSGISSSQTWASDMALTMTSPENRPFTVGGYNSANPPWDFDGAGSNSDGAYSSTHIGDGVFGADGTLDQGNWQFDFIHTWNGAMQWSDVTITLHKREPLTCADPASVEWLHIDQTSGETAPGHSETVALTVDAATLDAGRHEARLCITTDDPTLPLAIVPVEVQVAGPEIFFDRFEPED